MAERRMLSQKITESDAFLDLPLASQALYLHICMSADDDGFIANAKTICRMIGATQDDLNALIEARFLLTFEDGVMCVKHWRINNQIRKDRHQVTAYREYAERLGIKANGAYTMDKEQAQLAWSPLV